MTDADLERQLQITLSDYLASLSVTKAIFGWEVFTSSGDQIGKLYLIGKSWRLILPGRGIDIELEYRCSNRSESQRRSAKIH